MKVDYDISVLGGGVTNQRARTGIFRVVEQLLLHLATRPEVALQLSTMAYLKGCVSYLDGAQRLAHVPFPYPPALLRLEDMKEEFGRRSKERRFPARQGLKVGRELLHGAQKIVKLACANGSRQECDIYHSPFLPIPKGRKGRCKFITVYDLIPLLFPQYFEFKEDHVLKRVMQSIDHDTWVFCISEATKNDLLNYNPRVDADKVAVIPLGASSIFSPCDDVEVRRVAREKYGIPDRPYFLSVSTLEPRKNIESTIRAFARLVQQEKLDDVSLVLVGTKGWDFGRIFQEISVTAGIADRIIVTGFVDDEDLAPLYSGALAFVYPSYYEGFGLPPLEAMRCGTPVITSNSSSLPEVVGDAGIQVSPSDNDALCHEMLRLFWDAELRKELSARSRRRASLFSWEACADVTIDHYRRALQQAG